MRYKAITPVSHMHSAAIVSSLSHGGVMRGWEWADYDVIKRPLALLLWPSREMGWYSSVLGFRSHDTSPCFPVKHRTTAFWGPNSHWSWGPRVDQPPGNHHAEFMCARAWGITKSPWATFPSPGSTDRIHCSWGLIRWEGHGCPLRPGRENTWWQEGAGSLLAQHSHCPFGGEQL